MRKLLLKLHLYVALVAGIFVTILGATGSIMAFEPELDRLFNPSLFTVKPENHPAMTITSIIGMLHQKYPGVQIGDVGFAGGMNGSILASLDNGATLFINPYTGQILGQRTGQSFLDYVHQAHIRLLSGQTGKTIMGVAGIAMLFLVITGIILWWRYKQFSLKLNGTLIRAMFDLHTVTGIYSALFLLFLSATGVVIAYDGTFLTWMFKATDTKPIARYLPSTPLEGVDPISPDSALGIALTSLPGSSPIGISLPSDPKGSFLIRTHFPEDRTPGGRSWACVDQFSGQVLVSQNSRTAPGPTRAMILNRAIHTGDIFGIFSKSLLSLSSLLVVLQAVSGVILWWKRDRKSKTAGVKI